MTDDIEKILSKKVGDWTEEEMIKILGPRDTYIRMKYSKCGYEENVPDWVLGEFQGEDIALGHSQKEVSTECPRCNAAIFKKK